MYKIRLHGIEIACDDPAEALRLVREASRRDSQENTGIPARRGRPPTNGKPVREQRDEAALKASLAFLTAVSASDPSGIGAARVVEAMGLGGKRGIGGALISVRRVLANRGFEAADVYRMVGERGSRRWKPGQRIREAVESLAGGGQ